MKKVKVKTKQKPTQKPIQKPTQKQKQSQIVNVNLGNILKKSQPKRKSQPKAKQFYSAQSSVGPSISFNAPPIREYVDTSLINRPSPGDYQLVLKNTPTTTTPQSMGQWSQIENNNPLTNQQPQQKSIAYNFGEYLMNSNIPDEEFNRQMNYRQIGYINQKQKELDDQQAELDQKKKKDEAIKAATTPQKTKRSYNKKSKPELPSIQELPSTQESNPPTNPLISNPPVTQTITSEPVPNPNIITELETEKQRAKRLKREQQFMEEHQKELKETQQQKPIDKKIEDYMNAASPGRNRIIDEPITEPSLNDEPIQPPSISGGLGKSEPEVKKKPKGTNKKK